MMSIRCIQIEDEEPAQEILKLYLVNYPSIKLMGTFNNVFYAQDYLKENQVDLIFLDIQLPGITGLEFLKKIKNPPLVVFTTAYEQHAVEAFELEVFDYLLKPYSLDRFNQTYLRLIDRFSNGLMNRAKNSSSKKIILKSGKKAVKISAEAIVYVESIGESMMFYTDNGDKIKTRMSMKQVLDLIGHYGFIRHHRSFITNHNYILSYTSKEVITELKVLPIGRTYKTSFVQMYNSK